MSQKVTTPALTEHERDLIVHSLMYARARIARELADAESLRSRARVEYYEMDELIRKLLTP